MISCYVPSSSIMVTLTVSIDVKMSGLAIDAMTVKVSSSSIAVSPSIVTGWHIELPTGVAGGMVRVWLDSGWKSLESEGNREINIYKVKLRKTTSTHHCLGYYKVATAIYSHVAGNALMSSYSPRSLSSIYLYCEQLKAGGKGLGMRI